MRSGDKLYGFEKDINRLIDAFALQAEVEGFFSFPTFKRLFKESGYAYLHQAYPGCEHSPEYTQLLYATALDRLDVLSPTAPPGSPLWRMHVDPHKAPGSAAATAAAAAAAEAGVAAQKAPAMPPGPPVQQCTISSAGPQTSFGANNTLQHDTQVAPAGPAPVQPPQAQFLADAQQQLVLVQTQEQQQQQQQEQQPELAQTQQYEQHQHFMGVDHPPQSPQSPQVTDLIPDLLLQSPMVDGFWQQPAAQDLPALEQLLQQEQQHLPLVDGQLQGQQLQPATEQLQQVQQQEWQQLPPQHQLPVDLQQQLPQHQVVQQQQQQQQPAPSAAQSAAAAMPVIPPDDEDIEDDFLNDLLAIFDEAEGLESGAAAGLELLPAPDGAEVKPDDAFQLAPGGAGGNGTVSTAAAAAAGAAVAPTAAGAAMQAPQRPACPPGPPPPPPTKVPLSVKAAVVFMLHCLHDTQLALPKTCIYVPLQLLRLLVAAAAEFRAAGAAATDALLVLQLLLTKQRLLVGQFRRPKQWAPQLPAWLAPPKPAWDLGMGSAANRAAARAVGAARVAAVMAAANAARSLRNKPNSNIDPVVHRDAMFHIKTALRSLSNYKCLQKLCSEYADARRAIFEPLLKIRDPKPAPKPAPPAAQPQEEEKQSKRGSGKRGRGRGKRGRAAEAAEGAEGQAAAAAAAALKVPPAQRTAAAGPQQRPAGSVPGVEPPELFDREFGSVLQQLASEEATRMLVLLDPGQNPSKLKRQQQQQAEAERLAAAGGAGTAKGRVAEMRELSGECRGGKRARQQHNSRKFPAEAAAGGSATRHSWAYAQEVCDAGIFQPMDLQELQEQEEDTGPVQGFGAARQVLQLRQQRQRRTLEVAEEWLSAHDAMMQQQDGEDGEDMP